MGNILDPFLDPLRLGGPRRAIRLERSTPPPSPLSLFGRSYVEPPEPKDKLDTAWRKQPFSSWDEENFKSLKKKLANYKPKENNYGIETVNIMLTGAVGSGKSSTCNTLNSIFETSVQQLAAVGKSDHSLTSEACKYTVQLNKDDKKGRVALYDTRGLEEGADGVTINELCKMLEGKLKMGIRIKERKNPEVKHQTHVLVLVCDGQTFINRKTPPHDAIAKMKELRRTAEKYRIPVVTLLTKIDLISGVVAKDFSQVYYSSKIRDGVSKTADLVGVSGGMVFPIHNYDMESETDRNTNLLAMSALMKVLEAADNRIRVLQDLEDSSDED